MSAPTYYNYHPVTGEYLGATYALVDPKETKVNESTVYLGPPANATDDVPPVTGANQVAIYNNGWSVMPDHRGEVYWLLDGSRHEIVSVGIDPPSGSFSSEPVIPLTTDEKLEAIKSAVQYKLDSTAKTYGYDSILTAVTYVGSPVVKFDGEAIAFRNWRANCWDTCYTLLAQWQAGQINEMSPTEVVAVLPLFVEP